MTRRELSMGLDVGTGSIPRRGSDAVRAVAAEMMATAAVAEAAELSAAFGIDLETLTGLAETVPAGAGGLLLLPYFAGERVPDLPDAAGVLFGIRPGLLRPGPLFRAALEGTALNLANGVGRLRRLGVSVDRVRLVGGGAKNHLWTQIFANCLGAEVEVLSEPESAALGGALQAAWTSRRQVEPDVTIDEVAAPFITSDVPLVSPQPAAVATYRELAADAAAHTRTLFGTR